MIVSSIAAVAENGVIGKDNDLIWRLPKDMRWFMNTTKGHHVIMGRKNWESLPMPLPGRTNVVVTRNPNYQAEGGVVVGSIEEALDLALTNGEEEAFIIGGGEIYRLSYPLWDRFYYTAVHGSPEGDTFFPEVDWEEWQEVSREPHPSDEKHVYSFTIGVYDRNDSV